jgi:hypothetical protein
MAMPEAASHFDDFAQPRENNIWRAGQIANVQAESKAKAMNDLPNGDLRRSVFRLYRSHDPGAFGLRERIAHRMLTMARGQSRPVTPK